MSLHYDRDGNELTLLAWAEKLEDDDYRRVELTERDDIKVSTVWLGLNQDFTGIGPPVIFETMVFGGDHDGKQQRYSTEEQARAGHAEVVTEVFE
ncbi:hypothetical protein LCGC14_0396990 [marine sediment metagenome]|uniref:Uncharacterized protein n=1 Tax=marine sediment metagenome TaxID=412755 RepID=A0A0F9VJP0_9ZZZZ